MINFKKHSNSIYCTFAFFLMLCVFNSNLFGILDPSFKDFQKDDEGLVLGRLTFSRDHGLLKHSGLVGVYGEWGDTNYDQEKIYLNNTVLNANLYNPYQSQIGGQAMIYGVLDLILPFDNYAKLNIFHFLTATFSALAFLFFLIWTKKHFGILTSMITLFFIITSFWIIIFSDKLWWNLWSFYLPFLFMLFYLDKKNSNIISSKKLFFYSFLLVFTKCFLNGYEYISTTLIMFTTPILFYFILYQWKIKETIQLFLKIVFGAISGFLVSICFLIFQISKLTTREDNLNGFEYIYNTLLRRSYDNPNKYNDLLSNKSMKSSIWEVIQLYLNGPAYKLKTNDGREYEISFLMFVLFFIIITVFYIYLNKKKAIFIVPKNNFNALIIMFWASITAPLSWFILFKSHSYIHTHMNFIVWYMPFALFGYVFIGYFFLEIIFKLYLIVSKINHD